MNKDELRLKNLLDKNKCNLKECTITLTEGQVAVLQAYIRLGLQDMSEHIFKEEIQDIYNIIKIFTRIG